MNAEHAPSAIARARNGTLDAIRGLALVTITINHMTALCRALGMGWPGIPTLTHFGYSSAAEWFFGISGYLVGVLYLRRRDKSLSTLAAKLTKRAVKLYAYNSALFVACYGVATWGGEEVLRVSYYGAFVADPAGTVSRFLTLRGHPMNLDILPVYIVLLLGAPIAIMLARFSRLAVLCVSAALYVVAVCVPGFNLPGGQVGGNGMWGFNPAAWQFLFFGGMLLAPFHVVERLEQAYASSRRAAWVTWSVLVAASVLFVTSLPRFRGFVGAGALHGGVWETVQLWLHAASDKAALGPVRLVHAAIVFASLVAIVARAQVSDRMPGYRVLVRIGSRSLSMFVWSVILAYVGAVLWRIAGGAYLAYVAVAFSVVVAFAALAYAPPLRGVFVRWHARKHADVMGGSGDVR
jgi:hypothetical protein